MLWSTAVVEASEPELPAAFQVKDRLPSVRPRVHTSRALGAEALSTTLCSCTTTPWVSFWTTCTVALAGDQTGVDPCMESRCSGCPRVKTEKLPEPVRSALICAMLGLSTPTNRRRLLLRMSR
jgi:hypothetical protein